MSLRRTLFLSTAVAAGATSVAVPASADTCDPARMMLVLDQSSSMVRNSIGGETLWEIAVGALDFVTTSFESKLEMGLMKFPSPNECSPGTVFEYPTLNNASAVMSHLQVDPPISGNYTPMYQTLDAAEDIPELSFNDVPNYVVLITDGWQWCSDATAAQDRFKPISEVADLKAKGIKTFVVGFGGSVDTLTLNGMAVEGGTAIPGCDPTNTSASASDNCYYQADDPNELLDALTDIANTASAEICDGLDNDCDGKVDEGVTRACSTDCGSGIEVCDYDAPNGPWVGCDAPPEEPEICDGLDNDCDGTTDPGCDCIPGQERECGEESTIGVCKPGVQSCGSNAKWGDCEGSVGPTGEECNGDDDDCDGFVDEAKFEGEVSGSLCGPGFECVSGECEPLDPVVPPEDEPQDESSIPALDDGGTASGCGCRTTAPGAGGLATGLLGMIGLVAVFRRRRRR